MAGHVRRGRLFVPEFAATVDVTPNDWFRDDVPDYLWPLMIAESQGNSSLIRFMRWQGAVQADLKDSQFVQFCCCWRSERSLDR
jgi:hypothetical protein